MTSFDKKSYKLTTKGKDVINSDSDDDDDRSVKPSVLRADQFRSNSAHRFKRRAEKVWAVSPKQQQEEEKVGDIVQFGKSSYFIIDIFEKEIMELGDEIDLNFKRFNNFEVVHGDAPRDHHFYYYRCCYSSCCCVCASGKVEKEWGSLERELASRDGFKGVSFFVRTYSERKELMRVAVTAKTRDLNHSIFFFDLKFPSEYPYQAPSFFYHSYGLPLSTPETEKKYLKPKLCYNILDVFLHIEEIVLMKTSKSYQQMLEMMKQPLAGFSVFVKGYFRKKAPLILRNMMEEMDMENEKDKKMFLKMYIAFDDNKANCEHLLTNDLKEEVKSLKEKECYYYSYSSQFPTMISRFDDNQKTSKSQNIWSKIFLP